MAMQAPTLPRLTRRDIGLLGLMLGALGAHSLWTDQVPWSAVFGLGIGAVLGAWLQRHQNPLMLGRNHRDTAVVVQDIHTLRQAFSVLTKQVDATIVASESAVMSMIERVHRVHHNAQELQTKIHAAVHRSQALSSDSLSRAGQHGQAVANAGRAPAGAGSRAGREPAACACGGRAGAPAHAAGHADLRHLAPDQPAGDQRVDRGSPRGPRGRRLQGGGCRGAPPVAADGRGRAPDQRRHPAGRRHHRRRDGPRQCPAGRQRLAPAGRDRPAHAGDGRHPGRRGALPGRTVAAHGPGHGHHRQRRDGHPGRDAVPGHQPPVAGADQRGRWPRCRTTSRRSTT